MTLLNKIISLVRKLLKKHKNGRKITILSFKFLGDTVFTIPAIDLLQRNFPDHHITIYCYKENKAIYELFLKDVHYKCLKKGDWDLENRKINFRLLKSIRTIYFSNQDIIFDLTANYKSALICLLSGANTSIGIGNKMLGNFYDLFSPSRQDCHQIEMFLSPLNTITKPELSPSKIYSTKIKKIKKILIHPFAGWEAKEWGFSKYIEMAELLKADFEIEIVTKEDKISSDEFSRVSEKNINIRLSKTIEDLIDIIKENDLVLSNDTGIIYIAALLGKTTFTIYGPTNPRYHLPTEGNHGFIQKNIACTPGINEKMCFTFGGRIGCPSFECMNQLTVDEVYSAIHKFIFDLNFRFLAV